MKLRLNRDLKEQAKAYAKIIDEPLIYFVRVACKKFVTGEFNYVEIDHNSINATSKDSTVIDIEDIDLEPAQIRMAIARAVAHCQLANPKPFKINLRENADYIIG